MENCLHVLTSKPMTHLRRLGGTASWSLNPARASSMNWVVCFQLEPLGSSSAHYPFLIGELGPISVSPEWDPRHQKNMRYLIQFERVAIIPEELRKHCRSWREIVKGRNPVKYGSLEDPFENMAESTAAKNDILDSLTFISSREWRGDLWSEFLPAAEDEAMENLIIRPQPIEPILLDDLHQDTDAPGRETLLNKDSGISIKEAKLLLAKRHEVSPDAIEIKITF